jgi:hypothetical protein
VKPYFSALPPQNPLRFFLFLLALCFLASGGPLPAQAADAPAYYNEGRGYMVREDW